MPRYRITTPEQVHFHYDTAGLMSRSSAWLLDQLFLMVLRIALQYLTLTKGLAYGSGVVIAISIAMIFVLDFGYFLFFELWWAGQSPGKRMLGLRVISSRGGQLTFTDALIRNLMRPIDTLPFAMLVGGVTAFVDPYRRRLGDLAAETLVVRDARLELPQGVLSQNERFNSFSDSPAIRNRILMRVTREERDLILDMMIRRDQLDPSIREDLFSQAAKYFKSRYSLPEDLDHLSDEQTVLNLALVIQDMRFGR